EALVNAEAATMAGTVLTVVYHFSPQLRTEHSLTAMTGEDSDGFPVRHVPPLYGASSLAFSKNLWFTALTLHYNGKLPSSRLAPDEREKPWLYLPDASGNPYAPAWMTIDLHAAYDFSPAFKLSAGIENLTNRRFRPYSSGIVAPGTSLVLSLCGKF
ncbi:MAG TPA: TonB-dependent receptor, partial [Prolixibacteraceae bacterium]|nr:TonB-dependent receptor [Prolixibacteraceae bacterium]